MTSLQTWCERTVELWNGIKAPTLPWETLLNALPAIEPGEDLDARLSKLLSLLDALNVSYVGDDPLPFTPGTLPETIRNLIAVWQPLSITAQRIAEQAADMLRKIEAQITEALRAGGRHPRLLHTEASAWPTGALGAVTAFNDRSGIARLATLQAAYLPADDPVHQALGGVGFLNGEFLVLGQRRQNSLGQLTTLPWYLRQNALFHTRNYVVALQEKRRAGERDRELEQQRAKERWEQSPAGKQTAMEQRIRDLEEQLATRAGA